MAGDYYRVKELKTCSCYIWGRVWGLSHEGMKSKTNSKGYIIGDDEAGSGVDGLRLRGGDSPCKERTYQQRASRGSSHTEAMSGGGGG